MERGRLKQVFLIKEVVRFTPSFEVDGGIVHKFQQPALFQTACCLM
jgi:hypothetical protein